MRDTGEAGKRTFPESRWLAADEGHRGRQRLSRDRAAYGVIEWELRCFGMGQKAGRSTG